MKKVVYVLPVFPVASETFITTEIKALEKQGVEVIPVCLERRDEACQAGDEALSERFLCVQEVSFFQLFCLFFKLFFRTLTAMFRASEYLYSLLQAGRFCYRQQGVRPRSLFLQGLRLACLVEAGGAQHLHAHFAWSSTSNAIVAARLCGRTVSFTAHGSDVYKTPQDLQLKLQFADFVIAVCERMQKEFKQLAQQTPVYLLACGVDLNAFLPRTEVPARVKQGTHSLTLLFIGRLSETKGVDYLIDALALMPADIRPNIHIAGDGPMAAQLQQQAADLNLTRWLTFLGGVERRWVMEKLTQYDAVVLPFCQAPGGIMDTGPLVLKEAMACKTPILTSDIMATGELLDTFSGWIARAGDAEDIAVVMTDLLEHLRGDEYSMRRASLRLRCERAYQQVQSRFNADSQARQLEDYFHHAGPLMAQVIPDGGVLDNRSDVVGKSYE